MNKLLELKNVSNHFLKQEVLKNLSFYACEREVLGIIGQNGCGKSTTIKAILNSINFYGSIFIGGFDIIKTSPEKIFEKVMMMPFIHNFYTNMSGFENINLYNKMHSNCAKKEQIEAVLKNVGLENSYKKKIKDYSLGMKQRLALAKVLLYHKPLIIMDEPLNGLDVDGIELFVKSIKNLKNEHNSTILIACHEMDTMARICDRVIVMHDGKILTTLDIKSDSELFVTINCGANLDYRIQLEQEFNKMTQIIDNNTVGMYINKDDVSKLNSFIASSGLDLKEIKTQIALKQRYIDAIKVYKK